MALTLTGKTVAFLVANEGVEQIELTHPWQAVLIAPEPGEIHAFHHLDRADRFPVDQTTAEADAAQFDAFVLPGGVASPDILRRDPGARRLLQAAAEGAVIAAVCHGPWTLIDAGLVADRTLAAWPSLATDLVNAGATWTEERVHVDGRLVTAQSDLDMAAFSDVLIATLRT